MSQSHVRSFVLFLILFLPLVGLPSLFSNSLLLYTNAQDSSWWFTTFERGSADVGHAVIECDNSDYVITGEFGLTDVVNDVVPDMGLVRATAQGQHRWNKTYESDGHSHGYSVIKVSGGGFLIAGSWYNLSTYEYDVWIIRTNTDGEELWDCTFGGSGDDVAYDVVECQSGGFALCGYTESFGAGNADVWIIRLDAMGNPLWNQTYGGPVDDYGYSLVEWSTGGFAIAGLEHGSIATGTSGLMLKTSEEGDIEWLYHFGTTDGDRFFSIVECQDGGFACVGERQNHIWLFRNYPHAASDLDITFSGYPQSRGTDLVECQDGGFAISGSYYPSGNTRYALVLRTDSSGTVRWHMPIGSNTHNCWANSIIQTTNGGFAITGGISPQGVFIVAPTDIFLAWIPDRAPMPSIPLLGYILIGSMITVTIIALLVIVLSVRQKTKFDNN